MKRNPPRADWFFPIEEASIFAIVTLQGKARDVRVPHKKALVAADTGDIVGVVGAGYKVFTNQQAVTLCHRFCLEAFPDTKPAEWTFVEGHGPGTRSWAAMDNQVLFLAGLRVMLYSRVIGWNSSHFRKIDTPACHAPSKLRRKQTTLAPA